MRIEAYRCGSCLGPVLIDVDRLPASPDLPCPYCSNRGPQGVSNMFVKDGELLPTSKVLVWPEDFGASVKMLVKNKDLKGSAR